MLHLATLATSSLGCLLDDLEVWAIDHADESSASSAVPTEPTRAVAIARQLLETMHHGFVDKYVLRFVRNATGVAAEDMGRLVGWMQAKQVVSVTQIRYNEPRIHPSYFNGRYNGPYDGCYTDCYSPVAIATITPTVMML